MIHRSQIEEQGQMVLPHLCPMSCARYKVDGECVHTRLPNEQADKVKYTKFIRELAKTRREKRVKAHKLESNPNATWQVIDAKEWNQKLPYTAGAYVWLDAEDRILYVGKAADLRRRHYTWANKPGTITLAMASKICYLETGWYEEILEHLAKLNWMIPLAMDQLERIRMLIDPFVLPEPPPDPR